MDLSFEDERRPEVMSARLATMSPEELDRYETYRRSHLPRIEVGKLLRDLIPAEHPVTPEMLVVVSGLAKLYVGDLVRIARENMRESGIDDAHPIPPQYYIVAARRLAREASPCVGDHARPRLTGPPVISNNELL
ncbi:hypothetical protein CTAYLR_001126 [Chrysophaeum taylorii]|uniref:TAFII28-like protein domain-containing protein n=1 Tax=Chrysophaeum taylorii TaxID=2483200 RepID=A0AAD7UP94_9STRA|nr:hypothetical protein CTAYLR_001126 [Chrysophaeum taylorii]